MTGSRPLGFDAVRVRVDAINDNGTCSVTDTLGKPRTVRYDFRLKGTGKPAVGEVWLMRRQTGGDFWVLDSMVGVPEPPTVTGSRAAADPVTLSLLAALVRLGLAVDGTSA